MIRKIISLNDVASPRIGESRESSSGPESVPSGSTTAESGRLSARSFTFAVLLRGKRRWMIRKIISLNNVASPRIGESRESSSGPESVPLGSTTAESGSLSARSFTFAVLLRGKRRWMIRKIISLNDVASPRIGESRESSSGPESIPLDSTTAESGRLSARSFTFAVLLRGKRRWMIRKIISLNDVASPRLGNRESHRAGRKVFVRFDGRKRQLSARSFTFAIPKRNLLLAWPLSPDASGN